MIPYGRQDISAADIDAVVEVLRSDFLTQGPVIPKFEAAVARQVNARYSLAVNSATSALHIACMALDLHAGDRLWTVPNTFVASANCARYCDAHVDFVDIDPHTWNLSVAKLRAKLLAARQLGTLPKIVVPVHFGGQPTDQEAVWELAQEFGFKVIEDASHSVGASRNGEPVGSCRWSDITVFSFHPVKIVTTGEGGVALTNSAQLAERMAMLRSHGITRDASKFKAKNPGQWHYEQHVLGYNYRMTDIHAALGLSQMTRLAQYVQRRNELADRYNRLLAALPIDLPKIDAGNLSAFHLYVVRLRPDALKQRTHKEIFAELRLNGIGVNLHYMPVHLQPYYRELGFSPGYCEVAEAYAEHALSLPMYATLSFDQQDQVVDRLRRVLSG